MVCSRRMHTRMVVVGHTQMLRYTVDGKEGVQPSPEQREQTCLPQSQPQPGSLLLLSSPSHGAIRESSARDTPLKLAACHLDRSDMGWHQNPD